MKKNMKNGYGKTAAFFLVLILTVGVIAWRYFHTPSAVPKSAEEEGKPFSAAANEEEVKIEETDAAAKMPTEDSKDRPLGHLPPSEPETFPDEKMPEEKPYTERSYQLVSDLVYVCREEGLQEGEEKISGILQELQNEDAELAKLWQGIVDELYTVTGEDTYSGTDPDNLLPQDDSLCFAVLGFQLMYDGEMAPELIGRCETALQALRQYPQAYVAVTGGGTAFGNKKATEADVMAAWFAEHGIAPERIIIENRSMTTDQNAVNTCAILTSNYPQIRTVSVITSDYHQALGRVMFTEAALLHAFETGDAVPYTVTAGPCFITAGNEEYSGLRNIMSYVWIMADPTI